MSKTNSQIVREYIEEVGNRKHYDRTFDYCSQDCVLHSPPYVGLGFNSDDRSGERVILTEIVPNSPAVGNLQLKDEIVRAVDAEKTWESFQDLKSGLWAHGVLGTLVTVTVKRDGKLLEIPLKRERIEGFDLKLSTNMEIWRDYTLKFWPDINSEIKMIIGEGDLVAAYMINSGTNLEYHHTAVWDECDIYRIKGAKIIEIWSIENSYSSLKQQGYQILPPVS